LHSQVNPPILPSVAKLSTKTKRERAQEKAEKQAAYERRLKCRELLFGKGAGLLKNLTKEESDFCRSVWEEAWQAYLTERATGQNRYNWRWKDKMRNTQRAAGPISRKAHRLKWFGSQKARWRRFDIPRIMNQQREETERGGSSSPVPEFRAEA